MAPSCRAARGRPPRDVAMAGGHAPAGASVRPLLVAASLSSMLLSPAAKPSSTTAAAAPFRSTAAAAPTAPARNAPDTFELTATERNFEHYYPTYLANGYWSMASSLSGTGPT